MSPPESTLVAVALADRPRPLPIGDAVHATGIFKEEVAGPVQLAREGLEGDHQADRRVHGGEHQAVYVYPYAHYAYWAEQLGAERLPYGSFGENLTVTGLAETDVHLGDELEIGTARIQISQPRLPCAKLSARFGIDRFHQRFLASGRIGYYARVLVEGEVTAGDAVRRVAEHPERLTVRDASLLYHVARDHRAGIEKMLRIDALTPSWRKEFQRRRGRVSPDGSDSPDSA